jgi:Mn-containing catalase
MSIMEQLKELLIGEMEDLISAEMQLIEALPNMVSAARHPKLKEAFEKHLMQTEGQLQRLRSAFELLGESENAETCKGMAGLIEEGNEKMAEDRKEDDVVADIGLISAAQKVEHYEIAGYGTARTLARQIEEFEVAKLLSQSLGEEESADYLLTEIAKPLLQDLSGDSRSTKKQTRSSKAAD